MHIVVNTLSITPNRGGVKTYMLNLLKGLLALDENKKITLLCSEQNKRLFAHHDGRETCVTREVLPLRGDRPTLRVLFDQIVVPLYCRRYSNAVLLSQASTSSVASPLPEVVIVQVPLSVQSIRNAVPNDADTSSWLQRLYYDTMLPATLWRANQIVAVSDHLRREIVGMYPWASHKVRTVYEGVSLDRFTETSRKENAADSRSSYFLFVSTLFPYKRADQAIRAFARATEDCGREDLRLKLAGKDPGGETARLRKIAREEGINTRVDILGEVPHADLPKLYRGAEMLLFPSAVETFGLPVLEAMACGTPVIASNRMSVPEIVGDAGLIVDPDDTVAFANAICRLLDDGSLRKDLQQAGKQRAQSLTWDRTARGVWRALRATEQV